MDSLDSPPSPWGHSRSVAQESDLPAPPHAGPILLSASCVPVFGAVVLTPVFPAIQSHYASVPAAGTLVPLAVAIPSLVVAFAAPLMGRILDRVGRNHLLSGALVSFALAGTAPLVFTSLPALLVSRAVLGATGAAILVSVTTLIGDYFIGPARDRYLGLQAVFNTLSAIIFFGLSGALGDLGWRTPLWLCAGSLVLVPVVRLALPAQASRPWVRHRRPADTASAPARFPRWLAASFVGIIFYTPVVQTGPLLSQFATLSPRMIGLVAALNGVATAAGSVVFINVSHTRLSGRFAVALTATGIGFGVVAASGFWFTAAAGGALAVAGLFIASLGCGLLLPTVVTWGVHDLPYERRGRGSGWLVASYFSGQFIATMAVPLAQGRFDGTAWSFGILAAGCVLAALLSIAAFANRRDVAERAGGQRSKA